VKIVDHVIKITSPESPRNDRQRSKAFLNVLMPASHAAATGSEYGPFWRGLFKVGCLKCCNVFFVSLWIRIRFPLFCRTLQCKKQQRDKTQKISFHLFQIYSPFTSGYPRMI